MLFLRWTPAATYTHLSDCSVESATVAGEPVRALVFTREFAQNGDAAEKKYKDWPVTLTGKVQSVLQDHTGEVVQTSISADGRYVAFESDADNLVPGDTNGKKDVFVRDRVARTTERISVCGTSGSGRVPLDMSFLDSSSRPSP